MEKMKDNVSANQSRSVARDSDLSHKLEELLISLEKINTRLNLLEAQGAPIELEDLFRQLKISVLPLGDEIIRQKTPAVLASLAFSNMTTRQTKIVEAHRQTFEWVFKTKDLPEEDPRSGVTLKDWLQCGKGIYWITGKPGRDSLPLWKPLSN